MRQHPIPQNILDIEFKLFTKFTVREFVYLAVGIGFGGIFIYLFTTGDLPAIIAFPIFIVSATVGIFLGLVKINDQSSDKYLRNFIYAITHPTQRVWRNQMIDQKVEQIIKPEINITSGKMNRGTNQPDSGQVVGMNPNAPKTTFIEDSKLNELEEEEKSKLEAISKMAGVAPTEKTIEQPKPKAPTPVSRVILTAQNAGTYQASLLSKPIGNMNLKIFDSSGMPVTQAIAVIKDSQNRVVTALKSDANGEIISGKLFPPSVYNIDVQSEGKNFPAIQMVLEETPLPPIKITAI